MSDDKRFVTLTKSSGQSWADEEDAPSSAPEPKTAKSWGTVQAAKPLSLAEIQEEEAKKEAAKEAAKPARREPRGDYQPREQRGGGGDYQPREQRGGGGDYQPRGDRGDYPPRGDRQDREPREPKAKNPVPDAPPFVAFIGNLAYSVTEDTIWEFFGELGVDQVRMVNDGQTGKPKGFAYVHLKDRAGLENALTCDGMDFYGRRLNVDVAAPKPREERGQWGPRDGGAGGASSGGRRPFGERGFGDRSFGPRGGDRDGPAERPKLNLAPRTKTEEAPAAESAGESSAKPAANADLFGGAVDRAKMDKIADERLKKEQERDQRRKDELKAAEERRQKEREEREKSRDMPAQRGRGGGRGGHEEREPRQAPPKSDKETEIDGRSSWRSDRSKQTEEAPRRGGAYGGGRGGGFGGSGPRGGGAAGAGKTPEKKWVEDSEGFKTKKDEKPAGEAKTGGSWVAVASKPTASDDAKNAANPYGALDE